MTKDQLIGITKNKIDYIKKQPIIDTVYLEYYENLLDILTKDDKDDIGSLTLRDIQNFECPKFCRDCPLNDNTIGDIVCSLVHRRDKGLYDKKVIKNE